MARTRSKILVLCSAVFALSSLASSPVAAKALEEQALQLVPMDESIAVFSGYDLGEICLLMAEPDRLRESPGGAIAKVTRCSLVSFNEKEVLPGGAAGVAGMGIRGPTIT